MQLDEYTKRPPGLLTNKYKLLMMVILIFGIEFAWLLRDSEITNTAKNGYVVGLFVAGGFFSIFLTVLAKKLDEDTLRRRKNFTDNLQRELGKERNKRTAVREACKKIREWKCSYPHETEKGVFPFGDGVKVELTENTEGAFYAVLHVEGKPPKEYRLYK